MSPTASKVNSTYPSDPSFVDIHLTPDGLKVIERFFTVPLDYTKPEGEKIRVFARHIIPKAKAKTPEEEKKLPFREHRLII